MFLLESAFLEMSNREIMDQQIIAAGKGVWEQLLLLWFCSCSVYIDLDAPAPPSLLKSWPGRDAALGFNPTSTRSDFPAGRQVYVVWELLAEGANITALT